MEVNRFHHKAAQKESCEKEKLHVGFQEQISGFCKIKFTVSNDHLLLSDFFGDTPKCLYIYRNSVIFLSRN